MLGNNDKNPGEETKNDGRNTREHIHQEAHAGRNGPASEFRQIDPGEQAQRTAKQRGEPDQDERSLDGIGHPATWRSIRRRDLGKEIQIEKRQPGAQHIQQQKEQGHERKGGRTNGKQDEEHGANLPMGIMERTRSLEKRYRGVLWRSEQLHAMIPPTRSRPIRYIRMRARIFVTRVMRKTSKPASITAEKKRPGVASLNWLAITLDNV